MVALRRRDFILCHIRENNVLPPRTGFLNLQLIVVFRNNRVYLDEMVVSQYEIECSKCFSYLVKVVENPGSC